MQDIADLEFGIHGFFENHVFLQTKQNGTNIYIYQARALRALGLLLADGTPTVGGGKTF